jgi:hypothetical protein
MRSTAIVKVARESCVCAVAPYARKGRHDRYRAECHDCGWEQVEHIRAVLDAPSIGAVQLHRRSCHVMAGRR